MQYRRREKAETTKTNLTSREFRRIDRGIALPLWLLSSMPLSNMKALLTFTYWIHNMNMKKKQTKIIIIISQPSVTASSRTPPGCGDVGNLGAQRRRTCRYWLSEGSGCSRGHQAPSPSSWFNLHNTKAVSPGAEDPGRWRSPKKKGAKRRLSSCSSWVLSWFSWVWKGGLVLFFVQVGGSWYSLS